MSIEELPIQQEYSSKSAQEFLDIVQRYMSAAEIEQVLRALQLIQTTQWSGTAGIDLIQRSIDLATILAQMHIDAVGVAAGLVFEFVNADRLPLERVESVMGSTVANVINSVLEMNRFERKMRLVATPAAPEAHRGKTPEQKNPHIFETLRRQQAEKARKMLVAMAHDPHAVILKLAYQLHYMRLKHAAPLHTDQQEWLTAAQDTREIYAPLAGRLGLWRIESELEDLTFEILEPEAFMWVQNHIEMESKQWQLYVDRVCTILREELAKVGLKAEVTGRVKHFYSFYKKLQRLAGNTERLEELQSASKVNQIDDLLAFRILVETTPECYIALGLVHSMWEPKAGSIKDFIAIPKPNGYSALHTTVLCLDDQFVEIQIRTVAMHEMAEYGVAMHWHSKEVDNAASILNSRELLAWLHKLADWQRDLRSPNTAGDQFAREGDHDSFQAHIFVFTPKGKIIELPAGSTPLDFAFRIHTKIGESCAGARITVGEGTQLITHMVPLEYELKSGETVDIIMNRNAHPTRDWLTIAHTATARSKIRRYLKAHERDINIQIGRDRLDRELRILGMTRGIWALTENIQRWLEEEYNGKSFEDLLAAIGSDEIRPHAIAVKLVDRWQQLVEPYKEKRATKEEDWPPPPKIVAKQAQAVHLQVAGSAGLLTSLANCCCPLPGDEIVGYINHGKGAIVHRADCKNIERYRQRERERLVNVDWTGMGQKRYLAPVTIRARDRAGLIRDIAAVVSDAGVNMTSVSSNVGGSNELAVVNATLEIEGLEQMERLFIKLERIKGVIHVERDLGKGK